MLKITRLRTPLLVALLALSLSACGFHLRGSIPLPDGIADMFVDAPKGSFKDTLEEILGNGGGNVQASRGGANAILVLQDIRSDRNVGTLDQRGKVNSYDLIFTVKYSLQDTSGKELRNSSLSETRRYNFIPEQVVESESEEADLFADMERDISLRIVRQLSTVTDLDYAPGG